MPYVVVKQPGEQATMKKIDTKEVEYELLSQSVEGFIEVIHMSEKNSRGQVIDMWINEEGKINGMKPNLNLGFDIICGPILICVGTRNGESIAFDDLLQVGNILHQLEQYHIADPDSVEVPEPRITIETFDSFDDLKKKLEE